MFARDRFILFRRSRSSMAPRSWKLGGTNQCGWPRHPRRLLQAAIRRRGFCEGCKRRGDTMSKRLGAALH
eukprot:s6838_g2.t1